MEQRGISVAATINGAVNKEPKVSEQDSQAGRINSEIAGMWEAVSEITMARRSIMINSMRSTVNVNSLGRGSRVAVADTETAVAVVRIRSDRGIGG